MTESAPARVYVDHNAGSPPRPEVVRVVAETLGTVHGNPSSLHEAGQDARRTLERARHDVASLVGATSESIVFTASGTEANNLALVGTVRAWGRAPGATARGRIIVGATEHHAVLHPAEALAEEGIQLVRLGVDGDGVISPERLTAALAMDAGAPTLVSIGWANNETGVLQNVPVLARVAKAAGAIVHTDAVQAAGRVRIDLGSTDVDLCSLSAHKLGGPKGAGALVVRAGSSIEPILRGGGQERGRRSGTPNVPAIAGMGEACRIAKESLEGLAVGLATFTRTFESALADRFPGAVVHGAGATRLPGTTSVALPGAEAEALLIALDLEGVAASAGAACTTGAVERSHVLEAMGIDPELSRGTIRVSFGWSNAVGDVSRVLEALGRAWSPARA